MDSHSWSLDCLSPTPDLCQATAWALKGPRQVPSSVDVRKVKGQLGVPKALVSQAAGLPPTSHTRRPAQSWEGSKCTTCPPHAETKGLEARALPRHLPGTWLWRSQGCPTLDLPQVCMTSVFPGIPVPPVPTPPPPYPPKLPPSASHSRLALNGTGQLCPPQTLRHTGLMNGGRHSCFLIRLF